LWRYFKNNVQILTLPLAQFSSRLGRDINAWIQAPRLNYQIENLQHELANLKAKQTESNTLMAENLELRNLSLVPAPINFKKLGVEIIGRQNDESGTYYLINRGAEEGMELGMPLVAGLLQESARPRAILVGIIKNVSAHTSLFSLTTSNSSQILAEVVNETHSRGLAQGEYNLAIKLKFILLTETITPSLDVVTSNLDELIPPGLLIGTITSVDRPEGDFFLNATVAPSIPLEEFHFLYALKRS
jgi:rod shape-determining protein MreC